MVDTSNIEEIRKEKLMSNYKSKSKDTRIYSNIELINQLVGWKPQRNLSRVIADIFTEMKKDS